MVDDVEGDGAAVVGNDQICPGASGMDQGIFQKIDQDLFDQQEVHGDHQHLVRRGHMDGSAGKTLLQPVDGFGYHLFYQFRFFGHRMPVALYPCDGQKILHHIKKPVGIVVDGGDQRQLLVRIEFIVILNI